MLTSCKSRVLLAKIVSAILVLSCVTVYSQSTPSKHTRALRNIIEEKMRIDADSLHIFLSNPEAYRARHPFVESSKTDLHVNEPQSFTNKKITTTNNVETEVHAAVNPTNPNNMVCAAISPTSVPLSCSIYYSHDGGTTWKKSTFATRQHGSKGTVLGGGDPVFCYDHTGALYFSWIMQYLPTGDANTQNMEVYWAKSTDGGVTFQRDETKDAILLGRILNKDPSDPNSVVADKQWIMCDQSNSIYRGNLYAALLQSRGDEWLIRLRRKSADRDQFDSSSVTAQMKDLTYGQQASVDVDTLGRVHMAFCGALSTDTTDKGTWYWHLYDAVSVDGGRSFESVNKISTAFFLPYDPKTDAYLNIPVGAASADVYPQIVCDKLSSPNHIATNAMYCAWVASGIDSIGKQGLDVYFSRSVDGGHTWSDPKIINDDALSARTQVYAAMAVNEEGKIVLTWYDRRGDAADKIGHYYMAMSFDQGKTFTKNVPITTQSTDFSGFTGAFARATGEYNQVVTTKTHAFAFWGDGRSGTTQIYMAKIPLDSTASGVESIQTLQNNWGIETIAPMPMQQSCIVSIVSTGEHTLSPQLFSLDGKCIATLDNLNVIEGRNARVLHLPRLAAGVYFLHIGEGMTLSLHRIIVH